MSYRLIMFLISIISLAFIVSLSRSIYTLWQKGDLVTQREAILTTRKDENQALSQKLSQVQDEAFIEEQARNKLNLSREGEIVVVLPKDLPVASEAPAPQITPNWQQWWKLFF